MPSDELVSIKIKKHLLKPLKELKEQWHLRSISDVIEFLLKYHKITQGVSVELLLSQVKELLQRIE
ncbi:hypothetical protein DRP04_13935, partial [Archaeoglobales archaeon]